MCELNMRMWKLTQTVAHTRRCEYHAVTQTFQKELGRYSGEDGGACKLAKTWLQWALRYCESPEEFNLTVLSIKLWFEAALNTPTQSPFCDILPNGLAKFTRSQFQAVVLWIDSILKIKTALARAWCRRAFTLMKSTTSRSEGEFSAVKSNSR